MFCYDAALLRTIQNWQESLVAESPPWEELVSHQDCRSLPESWLLQKEHSRVELPPHLSSPPCRHAAEGRGAPETLLSM